MSHERLSTRGLVLTSSLFRSLFDTIYANPASVSTMRRAPARIHPDLALQYNLTSVDAACREVSCTDPDSYMWYDGQNPSTRMHSLVARHLAATILEP